MKYLDHLHLFDFFYLCSFKSYILIFAFHFPLYSLLSFLTFPYFSPIYWIEYFYESMLRSQFISYTLCFGLVFVCVVTLFLVYRFNLWQCNLKLYYTISCIV